MSYENHEVPNIGIVLSEELTKCIELYNKYGNNLHLATPEEQKLLKKHGYQVGLPNRIIIKG